MRGRLFSATLRPSDTSTIHLQDIHSNSPSTSSDFILISCSFPVQTNICNSFLPFNSNNTLSHAFLQLFVLPPHYHSSPKYPLQLATYFISVATKLHYDLSLQTSKNIVIIRILHIRWIRLIGLDHEDNRHLSLRIGDDVPGRIANPELRQRPPVRIPILFKCRPFGMDRRMHPLHVPVDARPPCRLQDHPIWPLRPSLRPPSSCKYSNGHNRPSLTRNHSTTSIPRPPN